MVSVELSELEVLASHIKRAVLKCWISSFSKRINNFILQLSWIIITNNTVASSTSFRHSLHQVLVTPISDSEGEYFSVIIFSTHRFTIIGYLRFVANLTICKKEDSLLVLTTVEGRSLHKWSEDVGSTKVGIEASSFVYCILFSLVVVIVNFTGAPSAARTEAQHTESGTTWETLQEEDNCIVRDLHSIVTSHGT